MIEPVSLGAVVAALVSKALDRAEDKAVEGGEGALRRTLEAVRQLFSDDPERSRALERLEDAPDSPARVRELGEVVDRSVDAYPDLRSRLEALVTEARASAIEIDSIDQAARGSHIVQVAGIVNSDVEVTVRSPPDESPASRSSD